MTITIFGATSVTGQHLVKQCLHKGYYVKAFGRNVFTAGFPENENLELINGALFDEKQVQSVLQNVDAILCALDGATDGTDHTRSLGMKNIVAQAVQAGVKRIVAIADRGILTDEEGNMLFEEENYPPELIPLALENKKVFDILNSSSLDWTLVCPANITDNEVTGVYTIGDLIPDNAVIGAGDLAMFMINQMINKEYLKQAIGIRNA